MGNAGVGALPKVRACRAAPQNLLDFALAKKDKAGPKDFAKFRVGRQVRATALRIAPALPHILHE